jgi:hypothetical protein
VVEGVRQTGRVIPLPILQALIGKFWDTPSPTPPRLALAPITGRISGLPETPTAIANVAPLPSLLSIRLRGCRAKLPREAITRCCDRQVCVLGGTRPEVQQAQQRAGQALSPLLAIRNG